MHVTSTFAMAALAAASSVSARAIIYRPDLEVRSPAPTGAVDKRATSSSASSSSKVSAVTTLPITTTSATSSAGIWSTSSPAPFSYGKADNSYWGVKGRGKNGPTNPDEPSLNTAINQTSVARLASLNSVDDWCTFGPEPLNNTDTMGDLEATTVAYCTKPRNNARVIPDGTVTAVQFVKTPLYVQLYALGNFANINMAEGDSGGELDPHGATNMGNPVGGNVTSNVIDGKTDVFYEEWMNYISSSEICFRVCIAGSDEATPSQECQHTLDEMGCQFVMAQLPINEGTFESCEADAAYPPGIYPQPDGFTSTFQQFYSGVYTVGSTAYSYQNAQEDQVTPSAPFSYPTPSSCSTQSTISNGLKGLDYIDPNQRSTSAAASATATSASVETATSGDLTSSAGSSSSVPASAAAVEVSPSSGSSIISASTTKTSSALKNALGGALALVAALGAGVALL